MYFYEPSLTVGFSHDTRLLIANFPGNQATTCHNGRASTSCPLDESTLYSVERRDLAPERKGKGPIHVLAVCHETVHSHNDLIAKGLLILGPTKLNVKRAK